MTRSSRLVEITGSEQVKAPKPGGGTMTKTVFTGTLFKMDGRTIDSKHRWDLSGQFANQQGVSSNYDLCQRIGGPAPETSSEAVAETPAIAAPEDINAVLFPYAEPGETAVDTLKRLLGELEELRNAQGVEARPATKRKAAVKKKAAGRK